MVQSAVSRQSIVALSAIILALFTGCPQPPAATPEGSGATPVENPHAQHEAAGSSADLGHEIHADEAAVAPASDVPVAHEAHSAEPVNAGSLSAPASAHESHASIPAADSGNEPAEDHADHTLAAAPAATPDAISADDASEDHSTHAPGAAPEPAATPAPSTGASTGTTHAGHTPAAGNASGPKIDVAAVPMGEPGESTMNLGSSSEEPAVGDGVGAFRTRCEYSHMLWDDPIVFPGKPGAAHLHTFFGNVDVDAYSTQDSIRTGGKSTCRGGIANRSSYWVPALIDAAGKPIAPEAMDVYYKSGYLGIAPTEIKTFPSGLRVIAGSAKASGPQEHAYWGCHQNYIGHPSTIPQCTAGDNLLMVIEFPQCWDGKNLDSADHMSHMAYPTGGKCPSTHPVAIPLISFNVLYPVRDVSGWRLSSDMYETTKPGGYSAHGDWFEGWDADISKTFVENCVAKGVDCHSHLLGDGRTIL